MKIRNKKLINALVAAFMVVVLAGSAFALVSQGSLVFTGTANVNAHLELAIQNVQVLEVLNDFELTAELHSDGDIPDRTLVFTADSITAPGNAFALFDIVNVGTVDARITDIATTGLTLYDIRDAFGYVDYDAFELEWQIVRGMGSPEALDGYNLENFVVEVGQFVTISVRLTLNEVDYHRVTGTAAYAAGLVYERAN